MAKTAASIKKASAKTVTGKTGAKRKYLEVVEESGEEYSEDEIAPVKAPRKTKEKVKPVEVDVIVVREI